MNLHRVSCVHIAAYLSGFFVLAAMSASYLQQLSLMWTYGTSRFEIVTNSGELYLIRNVHWWRKEPFRIIYGPATPPSPVDTWIGMRIDRQTSLLGATFAAGEWTSPFVPASEETMFTAPEFVRVPGMYTSTTAVQVYAIPYWMLLLIPLTWVIARVKMQGLAKGHPASSK
ncbi:MAG: hypothetical protein JNL58_26630 [Planctomyces sp.]|nr:hypothetical protein [Planctomyces sp.]